MCAGFVKDGMNKLSDSLYLNLDKMERILFTYISTFNNLNQG